MKATTVTHNPTSMRRVAALVLHDRRGDVPGAREVMAEMNRDPRELEGALWSALSLLAVLTDHIPDRTITDMITKLAAEEPGLNGGTA